MIYQTTNLSKLAIALCLVAFSQAVTTCDGINVYHSGQMVDLSDTVYADATAMCTALGTIDTLNYCTHAVCIDDGSVSACSASDPETFVTYLYVQSTNGELYDGSSYCIMNDDENCVRNFDSDSFSNNYTPASTQATTPPECCKVECDGDNQILIQGCGSDGNSYTDIETFCNAYCLNRTLSFKSCGSPGCGVAQGCPETVDFCVESFQAPVPVCGDNTTLYNTATEYCTALFADEVESYSFEYCDSSCTQENCYAQECSRNLALVGYLATTVCGSTGFLYNTQEEYCIAYSNSIETSYYLCSNKACLTTADCCYQYCVDKNKNSFAEGCGSDFVFYDAVGDFCTAQCANSTLTFVKCGGSACTETECSILGCKNTNKFSVCETAGYTFITNTEYCNEEFDGDNLKYTIESCSTGSTLRDCTQDDCDYKSCLVTETTTNGATHNYCGNALNKFYTTTVDFCLGREIIKEVTGEITCTDGGCDNSVECCFNYCTQVTFNALNPYTSICQDTTFNFITSAQDFCSLSCTTGTYTALSEYKCEGTSCTSEECCVEKCNNFNSEFDAVCSSTYDLIPSTDCATLCDETATFYTCTGGCDQPACDFLECVASLSSYKGTKVCSITGTDTSSFELYNTKNDYCNDFIDDNSITTISCSDQSCDSSSECCENYCSQNYTGFEPLCSTSYTKYNTLAEFCTADCISDVPILQCEGSNCDLTECCIEECKAGTYIQVCDQTTYETLDEEEACTLFCTNKTYYDNLDKCTDASEKQIDCADCLKFKCDDQVDSYPEVKVCLRNVAYDEYFFESDQEYCDYFISNSATEFSLVGAYVLCGEKGDENCEGRLACYISRCKLDNPSYITTCDVVNYVPITIEDKCTADFNEANLTLEGCEGPCIQKDCDIKECIETLKNVTSYASICLTTEIQGEGFFSDLKTYCDFLVTKELPYTLVAPIGCPEKKCGPEPDCCINRCLLVAYDSCATDFKFVSKQSFCEYRCSNETDMTVLGCGTLESPADCSEKECKLKDCLDKNPISIAICLDDGKGSYISENNITDYCNSLIDDENTNYTVTNNFNCGSSCLGDTVCCNAVCASKTFYNGCDPITYLKVEETEFCSRRCGAESNLTLLTCGVNTNCVDNDCKLKNCLNTLQADHTGSFCLDDVYDEEQYFGSITDFCQAKIDNNDTNYVVGTTITFTPSLTEGSRNCCIANCKQGSFIDACDPDTYQIVDEDDYCNCFCDKNCKTFDNCESPQGAPQICTSCELFKCQRTAPNTSFTTVCLITEIEITSAADAVYYFDDVEEYCKVKVSKAQTDYALTSVINCPNGCKNGTECCINRCKSESGYQVGCDPESFEVVSLDSYCSRTCGGEDLEPLSCDSECDEEACTIKECEDALSGESDNICLTDKDLETNYYPTVFDYCDEKVKNKDTVYTIGGRTTCDGTCDETECCVALCNSEGNYVKPCNSVTYALVEQNTYCDDICGPKLLTFDICYNSSNVPTSCSTCYQFECEDDRKVELKNISYPGYCGTDDVFYSTLLKFCQAEENNASLDFAECADENGFASLCTTDNDCCLSNCQSNTVYEGKCEEGVYAYILTVDQYCIAYCGNERSFDPFLDSDGNLADQTECCIQECITTDQTSTDSCDSTTYGLVTVADQCRLKCTGPQVPPVVLLPCVGDCLLSDCNIKKCASKDLASYNASKICGTDGVLYNTKEQYCSAKELTIKTDNVLSIPNCTGAVCGANLCSGNYCTNDLSCCASKCIAELDNSFTPRCNKDNFTVYNSVETYCLAQCTEAFDDATCSGSICNPTQCCEKQCNANVDYDTVCDALPSTSTVDQATYCTNSCADPSYADKVYECDGGCETTDCIYNKCYEDNKATLISGNICANDGNLYSTLIAYCVAFSSGTITSVHSCTSADCSSETLCCEDVCNQNNDPFTSRCDTAFVYYETSQSYCAAYCASPKAKRLADLSNCGDGNDLCDETECCDQRCNASTPYLEKCDNSYKLKTKSEFCGLYCPDETYTGITCDSNCTQPICDKKNCLNTLKSAVNDRICLRTAYDGVFFFESLGAYCDALLGESETTYTLPTVYNCEGSNCDDEKDCCVSRCLEEDYKKTCSKETSLVVEHLEYCQFRCDNNGTDKDVDRCTAAGKPSDCETCDLFDCLREIDLYAYSSICLIIEEEDVFYNTKTAYCEAKVAAKDDNYAIEGDTECGSSACADTKTCCLQVCESDPVIFDKCLLPDYKYLSKTDFCTKKCNKETFTTTSCTGNCSDDLCEIQKCNFNNTNYKYSTVCIVNGVNDYSFYTSVDDFCTKRVNADDSIVISEDIGCESVTCAKDENCCIYTCAQNDYLDKCSTSNEVLDELEYCAKYCENNEVVVNTCKDKDGKDVKCDDCNVFICLDDLEPFVDQSICLRVTTFEDEYYFNNYRAFCSYLVDEKAIEYTLGATIQCTGSACDEKADCCKANCMLNTYPGYCDNDSADFTYISQDSYCDNFCANIEVDKTGCESGCTEIDCRTKACEADFSDYLKQYTTVCLDEEFEDKIFFSSVSNYCREKATANDSDYKMEDIIFCKQNIVGDPICTIDGEFKVCVQPTTNVSCTLETDCCKAKCNKFETFNRCNQDTYELVSPSKYCEDLCNKVSVTYDVCLDDTGKPTNCTSCTYFECEDDLSDYSSDVVCANDYSIYKPKLNFCKAKVLNTTLDYVLCSEAACALESDCCSNVCLDLTDPDAFSPGCNNTNFIYDANVASYCTNFCSLNRAYTTYLDGSGDPAGETGCCIQKCILNNEAGNVVCSSSTYQLLNSSEKCSDICNEVSNISCGSGDCKQIDCDIKKCELSELASYNSNNICGSNGTFYTSKLGFCTARENAKAQSVTITKAACSDNGTCTTQIDCCKTKCKADYVGAYVPVCNASFTTFADIDSYCTAQCTSPFTPAQCGGVNCTAKECCNGECNLASYNAVCAPLPAITLVVKKDYCTNKCDNTVFYKNIFACPNRDCTVIDCRQQRCTVATTTTFPNGNICGLNGTFYPTIAGYCNAIANNVITNYNLCPGGASCANSTACCEDVCIDNNPSYIARCDTAFNYYATVGSYCTAKCASSITDLANCGTGSSLCSQTDCCKQECNAIKNYIPKCDNSYNLITQSQFCDLYCPGETYQGISCDGGCTQLKCDKKNCLETLKPENRPPICLRTPLTGLSTYYYPTISDYCDAKISINDKGYALPTINGCTSGNCTGPTDCCVTRCLEESYLDTCDKITYQTVNHSDYCNYRCNDPAGNNKDVNKCYEEGSQVACANCKVFECLRDIISYEYLSICLDVAYDDETFYSTKESYCKAQVSKNELSYSVGAYTLCEGNVGCTTGKACCNAVCNKNNPNDGCDSTYSVYTSVDYCNDYCDDTEDDFYTCTSDCVIEDCKVLECLDNNSDDVETNICVSIAVNNKYFFESMNEYCETKVTAKITSYPVTNPIGCEGECSDDIDCCTYRCLENDNKLRCNAETYQVVTEYDYCNYSCDGSKTTPPYDECKTGVDTVDCKDCYIFECEDVAAEDGFSKLCLRNAIEDEFYFSSQSEYCSFMIVEKKTSFDIGEIVYCPNSSTTECKSKSDCCHERCVTRGDVVAGCKKTDFSYVSVSDYCTMECSGSAPEIETCGGSGCSQDGCSALACKDAFKTYPFTAICLTTPYNSKNFYTSVQEYCDEKVTQADSDYTAPSVIFCSGSNCASQTDCCNSRCLVSSSSLSTCDATTFAVITQTQKCAATCSGSAPSTESCTSGGNTVTCTTNLCNSLSCSKTFTSNSYPYGNICLDTAFDNKNFYSTTASYCTARVTAGQTVTTLPAYTFCKNASGGSKACANLLECCLERCAKTVTTTGCTSTGLLKTPTEICNQSCTASPYTMTYCGTQNCTTCSNVACYQQNNAYTDKGICLITAYKSQTYYNNVNAFCDAKLANSDTNYSLTGNLITCTDGACNSSTECCESTCQQSSLTDRCNASNYSLVTKASHCSSTCAGNSPPSYLTCLSGGSPSNCTQISCYVTFQCPAVFTNASYAFTSVCLLNPAVSPFYYPSVAEYCSANGSGGSVTSVPANVACKNAAGTDISCASLENCCFARCKADSYTVGCNSSFETVSHDDYCNSKCNDGIEIELTFCDGGACSDCKLLECLDGLSDYEYSTVCLADPESEDTAFFSDVESYCKYLIAGSNTDYTLDPADYVCDKPGCDGGIKCCKARCETQTYLSTCKNSDFSVFTKTDYCTALCNETTIPTTPCTETGSPVKCDDIRCCAAKLTFDFSQTKVCGTNGTLYDTTLLFCTAKSTNLTLERVDCGAECDETACDIKYCESNYSFPAESFPLCGSDFKLYTSKNQICTKLETDPSIVLETCDPLTCSDEICCGNNCDDSLAAVLYYDAKNVLQAFTNECLALCAGTIPANAYYCDKNQSIADCTTEYITPCEAQCAPSLEDLTTYCSVSDGFLSAYNYCLLYTCSKGSKNGQTFEPVAGCENYYCTAASCSFNVCLTESACREDPMNIICASDGNSYINECAAACNKATLDSDCGEPADATPEAIQAALAVCKPLCADRVCSKICDDNVSPVCADNGSLYDNRCLAECYGNTFEFDCSTDCKGSIRDLRCKYDCRKIAK